MTGPQLVTFSRPAAEHHRLEPVNLVGATIVVDSEDFAGVRIAAKALAEDFGRVTNREAYPLLETRNGHGAAGGGTAILLGSTTSSPSIQALVNAGQLQVEAIRGKYETFCTAVVKNPVCLPGCRNALLICGSDKRGTIFGIYTLSERIGVSPWYWWADVPAQQHAEIYALPDAYTSQEPSVKFRGIFINDEAPALTGFVTEKFGRYGAEFYKKVFELLLRLKGNFMWPAMWPGYPNPGSSFFVDDAENQITADEYGIVVSTSHHEPMQRATNEWFQDNPDGSWSWIDNREKITQFFSHGIERAKAYESYFTIGMRGEYDKSMKTDDPASVVQDVIYTQRALIKKAHGREDAHDVNSLAELLALYKEVQEYWDSGNLQVPEDVTLLFADDNFGSIRRLPTRSESDRKGGAGIYYHFEYVGTPRSYKWINSNSLGKVWHQLQEAHRCDAKQIWVFNVGDIKPMEIPLSFAMELAWDINSITASSLPEFLGRIAQREFGSHIAGAVAAAWHEYDRLVSLRRHEHIEADTFSLLHYDEANSILQRWQRLLNETETLYSSNVSDDCKPAFFELVLHPIKASFIYTSLRINLARNQLWAQQRRNSANKAARHVLDLFDADFQLSQEFHSILDGKWNHMMRQTHYGYGETWHAPSRDMISGLCFVQSLQDSNPVIGQLGVAVEGHAGIRPGLCNEESDRTHPSRRDLVPGVTLRPMNPYGPQERWFEIYTRGSMALNWECSSRYNWIKLSKKSGRLCHANDDQRIQITVDWENVPDGFDEEVLINVRSTGGNYGPYGDDFEQVHLPVIKHQISSSQFSGFVEVDRYVSVPAAGTEAPVGYRLLPDLGRSDTGSIGILPSVTEAPFLSYKVYIFAGSSEPHLDLQFNMTLDLDPENPMTYDIQVDDGPTTNYRLVPEPSKKGELPPGWYHAVQDCVWHRRHALEPMSAGAHDICVRLGHTNILLEKLVLDLGGVKPSYLGVPASSFVDERVNKSLA